MIKFGKLTDSQIAFLETSPFHLEQRGETEPSGARMLRVVYETDGTPPSRWFSSAWDAIGWEFIRPHYGSERAM